MNKIKVCSAMLTRCEFDNASVRVHFLFPSLIVMSKTCHQYKERSTALSLLNSPLVLYGLCVYQTHISGERLQSQWSSVVFYLPKTRFPTVYSVIYPPKYKENYVTPLQSSVYIYSSVPERKKKCRLTSVTEKLTSSIACYTVVSSQ